MRPSFVANDALDGRLVDAVFLRKSAHVDVSVGIFAANSTHFLGSQLGLSVLLTTSSPFRVRVSPMALASCHSVLPYRIADVVGLRSEKQVARITARRIVAAVAKKESIGNGTVENLPHDTMCAKFSSFKREVAMTIRNFGRLPFPALVGASDMNLLPKTGDVLRTQRRDGTIRSTHDGLLSGRSARTACGPSAGRLLQGHITRKVA